LSHFSYKTNKIIGCTNFGINTSSSNGWTNGWATALTEETKCEYVEVIKQQLKVGGCSNYDKVMKHFNNTFGGGIARELLRRAKSTVDNAPAVAPNRIPKNKRYKKKMMENVENRLQGDNQFSMKFADWVKDVEGTKLDFSDW
jgi:hypothetical protein